jgi:hypothetical protein
MNKKKGINNMFTGYSQISATLLVIVTHGFPQTSETNADRTTVKCNFRSHLPNPVIQYSLEEWRLLGCYTVWLL